LGDMNAACLARCIGLCAPTKKLLLTLMLLPRLRQLRLLLTGA